MNTKDNLETSIETETRQVIECKVYKKRWLILLLYILYCMSICMQWVLYSVIGDVIEDYYQVSTAATQWTSLINVVVYLIFSIPSLYILDKLGLRWCSIISIVGTCVGSWLKVASVDPSRFWLLVLGQGIVGIFRVLVMSIPQKLASLWFASNEISRACALAMFGFNVSTIVGFLLPPLLVDGTTKDEIEDGLRMLAYVVAIFPTVMLPLIILFFGNAPPTPPSVAQLVIKDQALNFNYKQTLRNLFSNRSFVVFLMIFGITTGLQGPLAIVMNQIVLKHHPEAKKDVGYLGVIVTVSGLFGMYATGLLLDKLRRYKLITLSVFICNIFGLLLFLSSLSWKLYFIYATTTLAGFCGLGLYTIAFTISGELSYPEPEGTSGGLLMTNNQIFTLIFTHLYTYLYSEQSELVSTLVIAFILLFASSLFMFVKFDMRKQKLEKQVL